jgi:hypothetical protein
VFSELGASLGFFLKVSLFQIRLGSISSLPCEEKHLTQLIGGCPSLYVISLAIPIRGLQRGYLLSVPLLGELRNILKLGLPS